MREFQKKKFITQLLYSKITIGILFILLFFTMSAAWGVYEKYRETKDKRDFAQSAYDKLETRENNIKNELELLKTDRGVEEKIRAEFGFVKEGEEVIVIVDPLKEQKNNIYIPKQSLFSSVWRSILNSIRD